MVSASNLRIAKRAFFVPLITACMLAVFAIAATAAPPTSARVPARFNSILTVKFKRSTDAAGRSGARARVGASFGQSLAAPGLQQIVLPADVSATDAAIALRADPNVEFVSTPGTYQANADPNDPYFWTQWSLKNTGDVFGSIKVPDPSQPGQYLLQPLSGTADADIDATEAQAIANTGSMTVGVIDTGVAYQHADLAANIFVNAAEQSGSSSYDDDGNGQIDDVHGWDFYDNDNNPSDPDGHGTYVASIIGANTDNLTGMSAVDPRAKIMPLRAAGTGGVFTWAAIEQAATYALANGVKVINGSFSGPTPDPAFADIIANNPQALFVFSAGNGGPDHVGDNHNSADGLNHQYPCDIPADNVICVAATDWNDNLTAFSDYGYYSVDLAAPGAAVFAARTGFIDYCHDPNTGTATNITPCSDLPSDHVNDAVGGDRYRYVDGTSMAAPQVAGAAALVWGANPSLDASQIKTLLVTNTDPLPSLTGKVGFGGRLNVAKAAAAAADPPASGWPATPPPPPPGPDTSGGGGGGAGGTTPPSDPVINDVTPPVFSVDRPTTLHISSIGRIRIKVRCREACTARVVARPALAGASPMRAKAKIGTDQSKLVSMMLRGANLKLVRSQLEHGHSVKLRFTVVATDGAGNASKPRRFTVRLAG